MSVDHGGDDLVNDRGYMCLHSAFSQSTHSCGFCTGLIHRAASEPQVKTHRGVSYKAAAPNGKTPSIDSAD